VLVLAEATNKLRLLQQKCFPIRRVEVHLVEIGGNIQGQTLLRALQIIPRDLGYPRRGVQEPWDWRVGA
jgi:hypothetical protein